MKDNKGITLIALVITIIVLLILAGVSIAMLTGENGLLTRANEAKISTVEARVRDAVALAVSDLRITKSTNGTNIAGATGDITVNEIITHADFTKTMNGYTVAESGSTFTVKNGELGSKTMTVTLDTAGVITKIETN